MIVGGPNTRLPHWFESLLSWLLALSCLGIAFYHYYIDLYLYSFSSYTQLSLSVSFLKKLLIPTSLLLKDDDEEEEEAAVSEKLFIPLTTHSRREWYTVSESYNGYKKRYHELYTIIKNEINLIDLIDPIVIDDDNEDNDSSSNNNLFSEWLFSSPIIMATTATATSKKKKSDDNNNNNLNNKNDDDNNYYKPLIKLIRTNDIARRLTSLLIGTDPIDHYYPNYHSFDDAAGGSNSSSSLSSSSSFSSFNVLLTSLLS